LQAAQRRLVESERLAAIGQMSAKVSHEVRNPLSSISLNAELLEDELQALPEARRGEAASLLGAIRSQVDVLSAVTEEYLRFARLPKPKLEAVAPGPVIEELGEFLRGELQARGIALLLEVSRDLPVVPMDPGQIRQALLNLVRNAAEAMPGGGTITLRVKAISNFECRMSDSAIRSPQSAIVIEVADTGVGIPPENLGKIFEPFFTTKEGGTGLGLAITRQIAADHGGSLTGENAPGGGSTFRLTLPVGGGGAS
jgi:two-component system NtrC family sensor kinase